ncbi:MAG: phosphomannomutase/phosphoglucomutase [Lachnospiraceae bacterium]|nr:phosphomannomutase/phosphoglucomutase [Lachnospiraceae bacterium]
MTFCEEKYLRLQNGSDIRGCAIATEKEEQTFTPEMARYIAQAFAEFLGQREGRDPGTLRIGIGRDSRITGTEFEDAVSAGLSAAGSRVYICGIASTPAMFQSTILPDSHFDAAVMITASHLPFNRNGMKFFTREGSFSKEEIKEVLLWAAGLDVDHCVGTGGEPRPAGEPFDIISVYSHSLREFIKREVDSEDCELPLAGLHIVVDAGNGAAGFFPGMVLEPLGADVSGSACLEPDGMFPNHVPNPENKEAMEALRKAVLSAGADLGVIFDCDGDRGAVMLRDGTEVNRNTLIALLSVIVAEQHPGSVIVTDSITSDELTVFLEKDLGLRHFRFKRGYKNVIDKGRELNSSGDDCELAIETSGHAAFRENHYSDDGAYLCVKIICRLAVLMREGKDLSELIAGLSHPAEAEEIRFDITEAEGDPRDYKEYGNYVLDAFGEYTRSDERFHIVEPNYEGIRVSFDDAEVKGWLLIRKSLHDPVMPMNIESSVPGGTDIIYERIRPFIEKCTRLKRNR